MSQGHLVRLLLTAFAVMLGVSFVTGTFVLRDSIDNTLGGLVSPRPQGPRRVGPRRRHDDLRGRRRRRCAARVPLSLEADARGRAGASRGWCRTSRARAILAGRDGIAVRNGGAPGLGFAFRADDPSFTLVSGRGPTRPR